MSLLREYIRATLLMEAAKGPQDLHRNVYVKIDPDPHGVTIYYADKHGDPEEYPSGEIMLEILTADEPEGPCGGAWMIGSAEASTGWGPMLYDVAMEYATMNGGGMVADRGSVSPAARKVWDYYMNSREDVTAHQLDDLKNTLTPEEEDNCFQRIATSFGGPGGEPVEGSFVDSPLSKRYTKPPTTIEALKAAGKLIWQEGGAYAPIKDLDAEGMTMVESYIRELLVEEVDSAGVAINVKNYGNGVAAALMMSGLRIGSATAREVLQWEHCGENVEKLKAQGYDYNNPKFPTLGPTLYAIGESHVDEAFRGFGYGKKLYKAIIDEIGKHVGNRGAFVGADECAAGHTSEAAQRVWESLARDYPSSGNVVYVGPK